MPQAEILIVLRSKIFPVEGEQSIECPNCNTVVPLGLTKEQLDEELPPRGQPVDCPNCNQPLIIHDI